MEQAFFQRFWDDTDTRTADLVRGLVASGQLEFINGGYVMHDEACPSFSDMLDQTTLGHRLLKSQFGINVKSAWQIDPFGHSAFQASVLSTPAAGFSSVFFMRADWQEIALRQNATTTEMIWAPSPTLGMRGATYAGILYGGYCTVPGLSMDFWSNDQPIRDSPYLEDNNVALIVNHTVKTVMDALGVVPQGGPGADGTQDIMLPLGCDFEWENAGAWYTFHDKLIHYLNLDGRVNAFYSTPSAYAAAKLAGAKAYTAKSADFFPYDFFPHGYLTGFYTSRPALKGYIRETSTVLQAGKQLQAFSGGALDLGRGNPLYRLERSQGEAQHHDAITGSSKQAVAYDYARRLAWGREDAGALLSAALDRLSGARSNATLGWLPCDLANATICPALELQAQQPSALTVYNSASHPRAVNVRIPVPLAAPGVQTYAVLGVDGATALPAQLLPLAPADAALREEYYGYYASSLDPPLDTPQAICARNFEGNYTSLGAAAGAANLSAVFALSWGPGGAPSRTFLVDNVSPGAAGAPWRHANGSFVDATYRAFVLDYEGGPTGVQGVVNVACSGAAFAVEGRAGSSASTPLVSWRRFEPPLPPPTGCLAGLSSARRARHGLCHCVSSAQQQQRQRRSCCHARLARSSPRCCRCHSFEPHQWPGDAVL